MIEGSWLDEAEVTHNNTSAMSERIGGVFLLKTLASINREVSFHPITGREACGRSGGVLVVALRA